MQEQDSTTEAADQTGAVDAPDAGEPAADGAADTADGGWTPEESTEAEQA